MRRKIRAAVAPAATLWLAAAICAAFSSVRASAENVRWGADYFPNVTLTTQDGATVRFYDDLLKGKIVAINLIYTTCQYACPLETARMAQVQRVLGDRMGRDVFFYSITIDPEHDTPAVLKEYAEKYHAGPGWLFLTGEQADIELISKKLGIYSAPDPSNADGHLPYLLVGNEATGQWMRNSAVDNPNFLARTIGDWLNSWQSAKKEALKSYAEVPRLTFNKGQYSFAQHCSACHTIGRGDHIGPDLLGVTATRDRSWLTRFIVAPDKMNAEGDPIAVALRAKYKQVRMPNLDLTDSDAAVLIDYMEEQSRAVRVPAGTAEPTKAGVAPIAAAVDLMAIVNPYLRIQQALNADSLEGIKDDARSIALEAAKLGSSGESIQSAAGKFQQTVDLKSARAVFGKLGDALMIYAKELNANVGDGVKVAYCPMAQKYWLQKGEKIQNPFYGKEMSDCGRINTGIPSLTK
jgi:protein SCO1/2